ncbi:MAG: lantibiotic immunity ABC transporter MutE/EpiE family permease subunit [Streptococcaceae bacterium]|jgi:ABC-2 type transport system permease protein|nr:lantibiotic immunity ABC transporter MutE/EpiE family permease subunit [Streptococcaceae bacterium]
MKNYIAAEYIKGKRSFSHFFFIFFPLPVVLICIPFSQFMYFDINFFVPLIYNWWPTLFLPMGLAVLGYQSIQRENESHTQNYYYLLKQNMFWQTKVITLSGYSLMANSLVSFLTILLECIMYDSSNVIILNVISASLVLWITTLFIIPLSILLAQLTTPIFSILVNLLGIIAGIFTAGENYWFVIPWGWSLRLITPIIKTKPNGTLLQESDPLNTPSIVYAGLGLAIFCFCILYINVPLILSRTRRSD